MDRHETIFYMFLEANSISPKADFRKGLIIYHGLGIPRTRKELEGSLEFQGFQDFFILKKNRYLLPRETPKEETIAIGNAREFVYFGPRIVRETRESPHVELARNLLARTPFDYLDQYRLAESLVSRSPGETI